MEPISDADQLRGHAHLLAIAAHAAFDNVAHAELAPDLAYIAALALELEDRGACHHVELWNFRQDVEQFLGHAVREIVFVRFATDVDEWEDGNRKSTRLNSSHVAISYAVFCLKKKKNRQMIWN